MKLVNHKIQTKEGKELYYDKPENPFQTMTLQKIGNILTKI